MHFDMPMRETSQYTMPRTPMGNHLRKQRHRMWLRNPYCHWCGKLTRLLDVNGGPQPVDMATVDHLFSRFNKGRENYSLGIKCTSHAGNPMIIRRVLACFACNQRRGFLESKITYLNEQRKKTGTIPLHEQVYYKRHLYLIALKARADRDVFGLISVMGIPLKEMISDADDKT